VKDLIKIERYLRRLPLLHVYELGDLDPIEAPHCEWHGDAEEALVLVYRGLATPTIVAHAHGDLAPLARLLTSIALPPRFYAHVSPGLEPTLAQGRTTRDLGAHEKMGLVAPLAAGDREDRGIVKFGPNDADELMAFYRAHYPGSYFEPQVLARGPYVGVRDAQGIACVAGIHVCSRVMRVAALGNIATRSDVRGRGLAGRATAALCRALVADGIEKIGLNVLTDNAAAIACYRKIGFRTIARYSELYAESR
jgi:ribosomal protein S18 acetylase RimI-like enzyme